MPYRTDLALESEQRVNASGALRGIVRQQRTYAAAGFEVTDIKIVSEEAAAALGKPKGRYVTVSCREGRLSDCRGDAAEQAECLAACRKGYSWQASAALPSRRTASALPQPQASLPPGISSASPRSWTPRSCRRCR